MADVTALSLLKGNLGYYDAAIPDAIETRLLALLEVAKEELSEMGISLDQATATAAAANLQAMYATWLYTRTAKGEAKPPMLSTAIRNWQVHQATKGGPV